MVSLRGENIVSVPLEEAIGHIKLVAPDGEMVKMARDIGIVFG